MENNNYYTIPSNDEISEIEELSYVTEEVKKGLIGLHKVNPIIKETVVRALGYFDNEYTLEGNEKVYLVTVDTFSVEQYQSVKEYKEGIINYIPDLIGNELDNSTLAYMVAIYYKHDDADPFVYMEVFYDDNNSVGYVCANI